MEDYLRLARAQFAAKLMGVALAACSAEPEPPAPSTSSAVRRSGGVSEHVVEGVSIFTGARSGEHALASGVPEVRGNCLTLQGLLVVWPGSRLAELEGIVRTLVAEGSAPAISTGGGETDRVPDVVGERCGVDRVFLGGPE